MKTKLGPMVCIACVLALLACQKFNSKTNDLSINNDNVAFRSDDCDDCGDDCCCYVELYHEDAATLQFCGTSDGASACSGGNICGSGTFSGGGQMISLTTINNRHVFCMGLSSPFWVKNLSTTDDADLTISCTLDSGTPQTIQIHLDASGAGTDQIYIETDADCEVSEC